MYKFKVALITLFGLLIFISCNKEEGRYSAVFTPYKVYKTKGDYFNYANTWTNSENGPTVLRIGSNRVLVTEDDTIYAWRWRLNEGYVIGVEITDDDYFTDITFNEIIRYNETNNCICFSNKELYERVIDKDPFIEFYLLTDTFFADFGIPPELLTDTLNKIIELNMLEELFRRTK